GRTPEVRQRSGPSFHEVHGWSWIPRFPRGWPWVSSGPSTAWRTCTSHPCSGRGGLPASPPVGHLDINVHDLPSGWADASDNNTIGIANLAPGQHKVKIQLVDANHNPFPGQAVTMSFTIPRGTDVVMRRGMGNGGGGGVANTASHVH